MWVQTLDPTLLNFQPGSILTTGPWMYTKEVGRTWGVLYNWPQVLPRRGLLRGSPIFKVLSVRLRRTGKYWMRVQKWRRHKVTGFVIVGVCLSLSSPVSTEENYCHHRFLNSESKKFSTLYPRKFYPGKILSTHLIDSDFFIPFLDFIFGFKNFLT